MGFRGDQPAVRIDPRTAGRRLAPVAAKAKIRGATKETKIHGPLSVCADRCKRYDSDAGYRPCGFCARGGGSNSRDLTAARRVHIGRARGAGYPGEKILTESSRLGSRQFQRRDSRFGSQNFDQWSRDCSRWRVQSRSRLRSRRCSSNRCLSRSRRSFGKFWKRFHSSRRCSLSRGGRSCQR